MRKGIFIVGLLAATAASADITDEKWNDFCQKSKDTHVLDACFRADEICELHGFASETCKITRQSVVSPESIKFIKRPAVERDE